MKPSRLFPLCACMILLAAGCDDSRPELTELIAETQQRAEEALARQMELERQLEEQRLAAERDAIERERLEIEDALLALEYAQADAAAGEAQRIREWEEELVNRQRRVEELEYELVRQAEEIDQFGVELNERERELAGREALDDGYYEQSQGVPVADYGVFHDSLSSYGSWFHTPNYGYVWQPVVVRQVVGWRPYTRGRWVCTDYGWTWVSSEPFGWATYHYGRWALLRGTGWVWVPGSVWAPAWVTWRSGGSHIGWAPLPPETLAWRTNRWDATVEVTFGIGAAWFNFVEYRDFGGPIHSHYLPWQRNQTFIDQTVNITHIHVHNNRVVSGGPKYDEVSRRAGRRIPYYRLDLDRNQRPGRGATMSHRIKGDRLRVAAPDVDAEWNAALRPTRVRRELDSVEVERPQSLQPEIASQFRESRRRDRERAEQVIAETGGREAFNQRRLETLQANRRAAADLSTPPARDIPREETRRQQAEEARQPQPRLVEEPTRRQREETQHRQAEETRRQQADEARQQQQRQVEEQTRRLRDETQRRQAEEARGQQVEEARQRQQRQVEEQTRRLRDETQRRQADEARGQQVEEARQRQQRQVEEQARRLRDETQRRQAEEARKQQAEEARQQQQQQVEAQARQQREEAQRKQAENAQRKQAEDAQRRQAEDAQRRQAEEAQRRQAEEVQRRQAEDAQRRQAEEVQRRQAEEARQQQQRQAEEQARRLREDSQRRQMEESRRQQQAEEARQRQQRQVDEQARRQREETQRRQMDEARRQQIEQARQQQQQQSEEGGRQRRSLRD